jgi:hypothetical protein
MYAPLSLVAMPDLKECLGKLKGHQVRLAEQCGWRRCRLLAAVAALALGHLAASYDPTLLKLQLNTALCFLLPPVPLPQHPEVQLLAASVLQQWLHTAVAQVQVLNDPRYAQDPRSVLETRCAGFV